MKWIYLLMITLTGFGSASCNGNSGGAGSGDSTVNNMTPMDSQTTSPSADTTYSRSDSASAPGDSAR